MQGRSASGKGITIVCAEAPDKLWVRGVQAELSRAIHNVLSNAVKYSYHSTDYRHREIRMWWKVPYDPGFRAQRFSLTIQSYGLGVTQEEMKQIGKPGFRGKQAIAEMPIGSGIGLSEVKKIMALHAGEMKFRSQELHRGSGEPTYLTEVELILPYRDRQESSI